MINKIECYKCGYSQNIGSLQIHHIDGNHDNNESLNLIVLCANCHFEHHQKNKTLYKRRIREKTKEEIVLLLEGSERIIQSLQKENIIMCKLFPEQWEQVQKMCYPEEFS